MDIIEMITEAYIRVYGVEKYEALSDEQKHDMIMTIVEDAYNQTK